MQNRDSKKYDGTTILTQVVLGDPNMVGKFIWNLWSRLGGNEEVFEKQQVGAKLEGAAYTTLYALQQVTRRITGIATGTNNQTSQTHNKGLLWTIEPRNGKIAIIDAGIIAMSAWKQNATPSEDVKITDEQAIDYLAKAAEALIETCGYTLDELKVFEAKRD